MRHKFIALLLPTLVSCDLLGTQLPYGAQRFTPPAAYRVWWNQVQDCSTRTGNFDDVTWYYVPGTESVQSSDGQIVNGYWERNGNRIVLSDADRNYGDLVRHEMLHALLRAPAHPREEFVGRCGGTVVCVQNCLSDGGRAPSRDPTAYLVFPAALEITASVTPTAPSPATNDGFFQLTISARNPAPYPVEVTLPPSGDAGPPGSFSYRFDGTPLSAGYDMRADAVEVTRFAAGERKIFIFDFHIGSHQSRYDIPPGTYRFTGAYGDIWNAPPISVTVSN